MPHVPHPAEPAPKRGRGRPPRSAAETEAIRLQIQQAAAQVFGEHGYHGVSVELILQACGLSRPTFYRYFPNADAVIDRVLKEANDALIHDVVTAIRKAALPMDKVEAGLLAWRDWGARQGPLLKAIFAEIHDVHSPAAAHRQRVLQALEAELNATMVVLGRPPFDPLQIATFVIGVEYLGYCYHFGPEGASDAAWQRTRSTMLRLALGLLGGPMEWAHAPQLAALMRIQLDGPDAA
ncbi:TetR/AcrR family transcriptional regulator [Aquabacterium lacunae]|uniref:TetR/AcrR family transcriptional regulator n=1 Tax=Aquabacterium lacunae TaxID=2528630 RepID=A0A4Q9GY64_9BURK|nr:TetR/AcrR family transcriptional regulator [Aquabacterium lacunae]TBO31161.1 TetR/AcrR family transcriptional regulator [Aquabacterium lacunae]